MNFGKLKYQNTMEIRDLYSNSDKHCLISPLKHNNGTRDNLLVIAPKPFDWENHLLFSTLVWQSRCQSFQNIMLNNLLCYTLLCICNFQVTCNFVQNLKLQKSCAKKICFVRRWFGKLSCCPNGLCKAPQTGHAEASLLENYIR